MKHIKLFEDDLEDLIGDLEGVGFDRSIGYMFLSTRGDQPIAFLIKSRDESRCVQALLGLSLENWFSTPPSLKYSTSGPGAPPAFMSDLKTKKFPEVPLRAGIHPRCWILWYIQSQGHFGSCYCLHRYLHNQRQGIRGSCLRALLKCRWDIQGIQGRFNQRVGSQEIRSITQLDKIKKKRRLLRVSFFVLLHINYAIGSIIISHLCPSLSS